MKTKTRKTKFAYKEPAVKPKYRVGDHICENTPGGNRYHMIMAIDILYSAVDVISNFYYYQTMDLHTGIRQNRMVEVLDPCSREVTPDDAA